MIGPPSPHSSLLASEFVGWDEAAKTATMRFTVQEQMCTWRGGVQGGLVAGYLDDVMGYAYVAASGGREAPLNLDLSMSLIRLIPQGAVITGKGRVVKRAGASCSWRANCWTRKAHPCARHIDRHPDTQTAVRPCAAGEPRWPAANNSTPNSIPSAS